ncbi:MAG: ArnT family glycosyltransferase [Endomicrobiia bacterium]
MKKIYIVIAIVLLILHILAGFNTIENMSPTYDEPVYPPEGYAIWRLGNYSFNTYHPPLAKLLVALPLVFLKPMLLTGHPYWINRDEFPFADLFLYHNRISAERILNSGRVMVLVVSCMLALLVYIWSSKLFGALTGIISMFFYCFSSNCLAHGTLATTDMLLTFTFILSLYFFWLWFNKPNQINSVLCGISTALTVCSKFSGYILFPTYFLIFLFEYKNLKTKVTLVDFIKNICMFVFSFVFTVLVIYKFTEINTHFDGLRYLLTKDMKRGRSSFFFGKYSTTGWREYFLALFALKTPVSFLVLLFLSFFFLKKYENSNFSFLIVPALFFLLVSSFSKIQIGLRHILPVYPLVFIWVGNFVKYILKSFKYAGRLFMILVMFFYFFSFSRVHPYHISYFNEIIGGPENGYKYFTDSNIDWGQGLKALGDWLKEIPEKGIYFCYFGTGDPSYYGIKYVPIGFINNLYPQQRQSDKIEFKPEDRILFAISITNLQATYYADKKIFEWLRKLKPIKTLAYSIFVYDLTNNPSALEKLAEIFLSVGNEEQAKFLFARSKKGKWKEYLHPGE